MRSFSVSIKNEYHLQGGELSCILGDCPLDGEHPEWRRPAVLVIPGGAYFGVSKTEGEPVASYFLAQGFQTFILTYAVRPQGVFYPEQLLEAAASVDHIRKNAKEYNVNPDEIFVVGFSAGGHLTANLAVEYDKVEEKYGKPLNCKPTAVGLSYPVIASNGGHVDSHENLLYGYGEEKRKELMEYLNLDERVTENTPPAFIWTVAKDSCLPAQNSLRYALALAKRNVAYELHIYPECNHGISSCNFETNFCDERLRKNASWLSNCASFFRLYTQEKVRRSIGSSFFFCVFFRKKENRRLIFLCGRTFQLCVCVKKL